jgi:hypothetical protein
LPTSPRRAFVVPPHIKTHNPFHRWCGRVDAHTWTIFATYVRGTLSLILASINPPCPILAQDGGQARGLAGCQDSGDPTLQQPLGEPNGGGGGVQHGGVEPQATSGNPPTCLIPIVYCGRIILSPRMCILSPRFTTRPDSM